MRMVVGGNQIAGGESDVVIVVAVAAFSMVTVGLAESEGAIAATMG